LVKELAKEREAKNYLQTEYALFEKALTTAEEEFPKVTKQKIESKL
jgi:hypothetical protein